MISASNKALVMVMVLTVLLVLDDQMICSVLAIIHMAEKTFSLL